MPNERLSVNPLFSWREAIFTKSLADSRAGDLRTRSPLERAVLSLIDPLLVPSEAEFLRKNTFRMVVPRLRLEAERPHGTLDGSRR